MEAGLKRNERDWAGQLISWLKTEIDGGRTVFQDATNDTGIRMESGRTKFPDVLLFIDKVSGIIFNGWELKFPDTAVDDPVMLENALEKARRIKADSFVTWNGTEAVIWGIESPSTTIAGLKQIKKYSRERFITCRDDLAIPANYARHEASLRSRAVEILHDLEHLYKSGRLKAAVNVCDNVMDAIGRASDVIVPQFSETIKYMIGSDPEFRKQFGKWKIYENSTLRILGSSSRKSERIEAETVLAKFAFYNLLGKILFYLTLSDNLSGELPAVKIEEKKGIKKQLNYYFDRAREIDYQAIFQPYFTDFLEYTEVVEQALYQMMGILTTFDFKILPSDVIGTILENLIPSEERQKFGQYFTSSTLATLVAYPVVASRESKLFDPTCGTGAFLSAFYNILTYFRSGSHQEKLSRIWGNDIAHFPAILSVINLYRQNVSQSDNFPRVIRDDFFNLEVGKKMAFPDPCDHKISVNEEIPVFDGIASNFPFIQQEDIPGDFLGAFMSKKFGGTQSAFLSDGKFKINERADYFTYCIYNASRFLKNEGGLLAGITSNAWLGKEYGIQFKQFLLDNFHIRYIVRSQAEHWFDESHVITVFFVLEKKSQNCAPTRFVTLNFKLHEYFSAKTEQENLTLVGELYDQIDNSDNPRNRMWTQDNLFPDHFVKSDNSVEVTVIPASCLRESLKSGLNWSQFFISRDPLLIVREKLIRYHGNKCNVIRGERTGWNPMYVIPVSKMDQTGIDNRYFAPYVKSAGSLKTIEFDGCFDNRVFICNTAPSMLDKGTASWIDRFVDMPNRNGSMTVMKACQYHKPYWYSINPKKAHIITSMNPYERLFFTYSKQSFAIDQRLVALQVKNEEDVELIAALLNSVTTLLILELCGTSRNLGALDLNANNLKDLEFLNPSLIDSKGKERILSAFYTIKNRPVLPVCAEIKRTDRIHFDRVVLEAYDIPTSVLPQFYALLDQLVSNRIQMKSR